MTSRQPDLNGRAPAKVRLTRARFLFGPFTAKKDLVSFVI
jgi:hypothetical protein